MKNNSQNICRNCGKVCEENVITCPYCGTPFIKVNTHRETTNHEQKQFFKKKLFIPAIIFTLFVVLLNIIPNIKGNVKYIPAQYGIFVSSQEKNVSFYLNTKKKATVDGTLSQAVTNLYGNKAYFLVNDLNDNSVLYNIKGKQIDTYVESCKISVEGKICAYTKNENSELKLYTCSGSNGKYIGTTDGNYVLSPDGKTVLFNGNDGKAYIYGKELTEIASGIVPVAVSNGAKYIYYASEDGTFVQKGVSDEKTLKLCDNIFTTPELQLNFNCDFTEAAVFDGQKENSFVCKKAGNFVELDFGSFVLLTPDAVPFENNVYGITTFKNSFAVTNDGTIYYVDNYLKCTKVNIDCSGLISSFLSSDNKTVCYQTTTGVYKIDGTKENAKSKLIFEANIVSVLGVNRDGSGVYFENSNGGISYGYGKNKIKEVAPKYDFANSTELFGDYKLYYIDGGKLYVSSDGKQGKTVKKAPDNLTEVSTLNSKILLNDNTNQTFFSVDGKKFIKLNLGS